MSDDWQFVDTNILVYAFDRQAGEKHFLAITLFQRLWKERSGCVSVQVLQEFYNVATRKLKQPLPLAEAYKVVADLGKWRVHRPGVKDVLNAIDLQKNASLSFWDAMILNSAIQLQCVIVWSEDLNPGQMYQRVRVMNPFLASSG